MAPLALKSSKISSSALNEMRSGNYVNLSGLHKTTIGRRQDSLIDEYCRLSSTHECG